MDDFQELLRRQEVALQRLGRSVVFKGGVSSEVLGELEVETGITIPSGATRLLQVVGGSEGPDRESKGEFSGRHLTYLSPDEIKETHDRLRQASAILPTGWKRGMLPLLRGGDMLYVCVASGSRLGGTVVEVDVELGTRWTRRSVYDWLSAEVESLESSLDAPRTSPIPRAPLTAEDLEWIGRLQSELPGVPKELLHIGYSRAQMFEPPSRARESVEIAVGKGSVELLERRWGKYHMEDSDST